MASTQARQLDAPISPRRWLISALLALSTLVTIIAIGEWQRWTAPEANGSWFFNFNIDSTPYALSLLLLPICWWRR